MLYYQKHVYFCVNQRDNGRKCCQDGHADAMRMYAKEKLQKLGLAGPGKIRINASGCMGRCAEGPTMVIYPDGVWYTYHNTNDIDEIIEQHLLQGKVVERLLMEPLK